MKSFVPPQSDESLVKDSSSRKRDSIDFKRLAEDSPVAFYTTDEEGFITFFNKAAAELWGRTPKLGKDLWCGSWKIYYPDGRPMPLDECPMAKTLKEGVEYSEERITIERPDNSFRNLLVFPRPIFDKGGNIKGANNTLVDITQEHKREVKEATFTAMVDSSDDAIISKDLDGNITSWNSGARRIFKYSKEEILGKSCTILAPKSREEDNRLILESIKKGRPVDHMETVHVDKYGKEIPISLNISPVKGPEGELLGASAVARDVSDKLQGEEKQAVLYAIVESSGDAIVSKDLNGNITSWNKGAQEIFGYSENEMLGKSITLLIPEERLQEEELILSKIRSGEKVESFETVRKKKSGEKFPVSLTVSPVKDNHGHIIGASKIARDISSRVHAQEKIERQKRNLQILNGLGKSISKDLDVKGILQHVTDATTKLTGAAFGAFFYNQESGEDTLMLYTLSGAPREAFENFEMPRSTEVFHPTFSGEGIVRSDDITKDPRYGKNAPHFGMPKGHLPVVSYLSIPVFSNSGSVLGGLIFGHPEAGVFTKEHEELVVHIAGQAAISLDNSRLFEQVKSLSEKKDEFIAVASHELKTPLTTIKGYLQVLTKQKRDKISELFLKKSLNQVNKLNILVEDLLNMSRIEAGKLDFSSDVFDVRNMLHELAETFSYSHKTHQLILGLGEEPVYVKGDRHRIEQAVMNLMSNAVKYSPKADKVYLKLNRVKGQILISIKDEGIGLSEEQQKQIFSRYYRADSTKGISGLGLGLYLSQQIIQRHDGQIMVESKLGEGSEFTIVLPQSDKVPV